MKKLMILGLVVISVGAQATVLLDDFSSGAYSKTITGGTVTEFRLGSMIGGDSYVTTSVSANPIGLSIQSDILNGFWSASSQPLVDGYSEMGYGFSAGAGGSLVFDDLNLNLSGENQFKFNFASSDKPATLFVGVRSSSGSGTVSTVSTALPGDMINNPFMVTVDFTDFTGVDFSDVDQIVVRMDTIESGDITMSQFEAVPEPGTMAFLALGGLAALRRRKKS